MYTEADLIRAASVRGEVTAAAFVVWAGGGHRAVGAAAEFGQGAVASGLKWTAINQIKFICSS